MARPPSLAPEHRAAVLNQLAAENAVAVVPTAPLRRFSNDVDYAPYRPDSDFWYLTEFAEPDAVAVLAPGDSGPHFSLFVRPRNVLLETWTGKVHGIEGAMDLFGADTAFPIDKLAEELPAFLENRAKVYYPLGRYPHVDEKFMQAMETVRQRVRMGVSLPEAIADPGPLLHERRLRKSPAELDRLARAVAISHDAHVAAMRAAHPGVMEYELEALVDYTFRRQGGSGPGYGTIVAGGAHACTLHYVTNDQPIPDGALVLIDAGCEWEGYTADVTRTWPVSGTFTEAQAALYDVVLAANESAIAAVQPGVTIYDVHDVALRVLVEGMVELRLLEGPVEERITDESYKCYFMHRTSHWLGMDVHDVGGYRVHGEARRLEPGMVLTVEPGLYIAAATGEGARYQGIGIRIEDDVVVTESGHEVLTAAIPKARADMCALIGADASP